MSNSLGRYFVQYQKLHVTRDSRSLIYTDFPSQLDAQEKPPSSQYSHSSFLVRAVPLALPSKKEIFESTLYWLFRLLVTAALKRHSEGGKKKAQNLAGYNVGVARVKSRRGQQAKLLVQLSFCRDKLKASAHSECLVSQSS
ncbi:hypothetical protein VTK73DRAFT_8941 [Phialemonium thermophilum]|uniref:Uncharacterized protein n=1 Tax=Phialemonium thermophilum TaxID=223376 RepID=A0ABR3Y521_9PEZI